MSANACVAEDEDILPDYRLFLQGMSAAYMGVYVQGNPEMLPYVTDPELIPMELLQLEMDLVCEEGVLF